MRWVYKAHHVGNIRFDDAAGVSSGSSAATVCVHVSAPEQYRAFGKRHERSRQNSKESHSHVNERLIRSRAATSAFARHFGERSFLVGATLSEI